MEGDTEWRDILNEVVTATNFAEADFDGKMSFWNSL